LNDDCFQTPPYYSHCMIQKCTDFIYQTVINLIQDVEKKHFET